MLPDNRNTLRKNILRQRDQLSPAARHEKSKAAIANLQQLEAFIAAATIFTYVHFRSELETMELIEECLIRSVRVCVPLTDTKGQRIIPYLITDPARQLKPGYCNIPEPDPCAAQEIAATEIDAVIVPGSVFDPKGGRLGYGGGYYDRFLALEAPKAIRIGLAFDLQVVEKVPLMPHDQLLHFLVTESQIFKA